MDCGVGEGSNIGADHLVDASETEKCEIPIVLVVAVGEVYADLLAQGALALFATCSLLVVRAPPPSDHLVNCEADPFELAFGHREECDRNRWIAGLGFRRSYLSHTVVSRMYDRRDLRFVGLRCGNWRWHDRSPWWCRAGSRPNIASSSHALTDIGMFGLELFSAKVTRPARSAGMSL